MPSVTRTRVGSTGDRDERTSAVRGSGAGQGGGGVVVLVPFGAQVASLEVGGQAVGPQHGQHDGGTAPRQATRPFQPSGAWVGTDPIGPQDVLAQAPLGEPALHGTALLGPEVGLRRRHEAFQLGIRAPERCRRWALDVGASQPGQGPIHRSHPSALGQQLQGLREAHCLCRHHQVDGRAAGAAGVTPPPLIAVGSAEDADRRRPPRLVAMAGIGARPGRAGAAPFVRAGQLVCQLAQIRALQHLVAVIGHGPILRVRFAFTHLLVHPGAGRDKEIRNSLSRFPQQRTSR